MLLPITPTSKLGLAFMVLDILACAMAAIITLVKDQLRPILNFSPLHPHPLSIFLILRPFTPTPTNSQLTGVHLLVLTHLGGLPQPQQSLPSAMLKQKLNPKLTLPSSSLIPFTILMALSTPLLPCQL